jgi:hypothetical protein
VDEQTSVSTTQPARGPVGEIIYHIFHREKGPGMPLFWAAGFAGLCLFSLWLGHEITLRAQEKMIPSQIVPSVPSPSPVKDRESSLEMNNTLGLIANSIDGTGQNLDRLIDAVNAKFARVQESITTLGIKIEAMPRDNSAPVDLTEIKTALTSLRGALADTKNIDIIVSSIKETSQGQDQKFRQLSNAVAELQKTVKGEISTVVPVDRDEFGTLLPPPKPPK